MEGFIEAEQFIRYLGKAKQQKIATVQFEGKLTQIVGLALEAKGCSAPTGARFLIEASNGNRTEAELVGFRGDVSYLLPLDYSQGIVPGARVIYRNQSSSVGVGEDLLGRVVDANTKPLDGQGTLIFDDHYPIHGRRINPLARGLVEQPLDVGVRAINGLLTIGKGQRIGLFAGTGVGKSVLLGMITKATQADVVVIALVGERGREVREFVDKTLGKAAMHKAVVVATPADDPPLFRYQGALTATTIAEYFRDQGKDVLLIMDSLTRFAQAHREVAISIGEPPASRGYPPSVFTKIPNLIERAGRLADGGSITAIYTVLTEGDDLNDPVADSARGILDGHIVLSRELAEQAIYPSISILSSISRTMTDVVSDEHKQAASMFKKHYANYMQHQDLINIGAYQAGSNAEVDQAIALFPSLRGYLQQGENEAHGYHESEQTLSEIFNNGANT